MQNKLVLYSPAFEEGGWIPVRYTGRGADVSPCLELRGLCEQAVTVALILDDLSIPLLPHYPHWLIWNLPPLRVIPEAIPAGASVPESGAVQGIAYGKHCYRGPKPPNGPAHVYRFSAYVLDCALDLSPKSRRAALMQAMKGHILQKATLCGRFQSGRLLPLLSGQAPVAD